MDKPTIRPTGTGPFIIPTDLAKAATAAFVIADHTPDPDQRRAILEVGYRVLNAAAALMEAEARSIGAEVPRFPLAVPVPGVPICAFRGAAPVHPMRHDGAGAPL